MLKIRLQGTLKDIQWFRRILEKHKELDVLEVSDAYANKGTSKYFRVYVEVEEKGSNYRGSKIIKKIELKQAETPSNKLLTTAFEASLESVAATLQAKRRQQDNRGSY